MTRRLLVCCLTFLVTVSVTISAQSPAPLRIVSAGPTGEVATRAEANEVRVVFSEPMVALGRVPPQLRPAFFHITPAVAGSFRWSGTTILIFSPTRRLPLATGYTVTIDATAAAVSGRRLAQPYTFTFTTPTAHVVHWDWYRPGNRFDAAPIVGIRFNQPIRADDVLPHVTARFSPHDFEQPMRPELSDASALAAYDAKLAAARTAAAASGVVELRQVTDWDKKLIKPGNDLVVVQMATPVPPESWVRLETEKVPSPAGPAVPERGEDFVVQVERALFVSNVYCRRECDPDASNPLTFTTAVKAETFARALQGADVTRPPQPVPQPKVEPRKRETWEQDESTSLTIEDGGLKAQPPASTWRVSLPPDLTSADGQTLGYEWAATVENWHQRAFTSFGDGHGVWETGGGPLLPFYARNFTAVRQWAAPIDPSALMATVVRQQDDHFHDAPPTEPVERRLGGRADTIQSHGLDLSKVLKPNGTGLVWAAVEEGTPIEHSRAALDRNGEPTVRSTIVQVTNLGITVKDSPQNTLVFVTRLDTGAPVSGAKVAIVTLDGSATWQGTTAADGIAMAPQTRLRDPQNWYRFAFLVTAEKDGDVAYVGSDWNEGIEPWDFGMPFNLHEAEPLLRGTVFADRGVYRLGEEVHLKAILRHNTPSGVQLLPSGTAVSVTTRDARNRIVDERTVKVGAWSTADWTMTLPQDGALGNYSITAILESDRPKPAAAPARGGDEEDQENWEYGPNTYYKIVRGNFLVAAYRRPDFRVDVTLKGDNAIAGDSISGIIRARYLFGAPMIKRPAHWTFTRSAVYGAPEAITAAFPPDRWTFVGELDDLARRKTDMAANDGQTTAAGELPLTLKTEAGAGAPFSYTLEGDVEDVSRQHIANRASVVVHPAPWYVGVRRVPYFVDQKTGVATEIVAAGLDGATVPDVPVHVTLTQIQWNSVRRAEGNGFYTWDTERKEVPAGSWDVTTATAPVPLQIPIANGGFFVLEARANADNGRYTVTRTSFYVVGSGYTAWQRYDHNRIDLVPEKQTYRPGDTARIMIQSPWEQATALVTTEREGILSHRQFTLTSTQQSIEVPVTEAEIPDFFVSVLLVKGRSRAVAATPADDDPSDPGKPTFRVGYVRLAVEDTSKRLTVAVHANREEYRPANAATVTLDVKDHRGRPSASEVTLWAVDYGVLSLTAFRTPDVLGSVYIDKALQVLTEDTRQRIVSRRVLTPKGETDGGGGGADAGAGTIRRDFRVLAFWLGSVITDANGHASVDVKLPESLTTYRIMAVAGDRASRFGSGDAEIRVNKPVTLKATFPRFLAVGDKASFGAVVTSQLKTAGQATVKIESLDPAVMAFAPETAPQTVDVPAGGAVEVRFDAAGRTVGRARVRLTVTLGTESDAFEDVVPVEILSSAETVSAVGQASESATERLSVPEGVVPGIGGLHVELASTALVGLGEGARYLVEYPYGCAEQRGSRALALLLAADLGDAFTLPGIDPAKLRPTVQSAIKELEKFQCESGGFAYWPGACSTTSPYLTAYLLHVFQVASDLKYDVNRSMRERAYSYLEKSLAEPPPVNESWWPMYTAWQAFAVKVLAEGGRNQDSNITRLYGYRNRMPVFALAYLHDALAAKGETSGAREDDLRRRMQNAVLPEAATAHVEELNDPYLLWFWNSNVRSTAIVLNSLVRSGQPSDQFRPFVSWLLQVRDKGRWRNTQENALALEALVGYYRKYEAVVPDFTARVTLGSDTLATHAFQGRSTTSVASDMPIAKLAPAAGAADQPLTFTKQGAGTLFYSARLRYALDELFQQGLDQGIRIERGYAPYVESGTRPVATSFKAGDLIRVTLTLQLTKERRFVAVTDPLPAGFEPVESWFASSAAALSRDQDDQGESTDSWTGWWQRGGFDRVERHDDRVELFATRLSEGRHVFSYIVRATTAGTYRTAPARAEEMYEPEVFGRTQTAVIEVKK